VSCAEPTFVESNGDGGASPDATKPEDGSRGSADAGHDVVHHADAPLDVRRDGAPHDVDVRFKKPTTLASGLGALGAITLDVTRLYWVVRELPSATTGGVQSVLKDGTGGVLTLAAGQPSPLDIALDLSGLYFSVNTASPPPAAPKTQCLVMRLVDGKSPTCITSASYQMVRMALADSEVLFIGVDAQTNSWLGTAAKAPGAPPNTGPARAQPQAIAGYGTEIYVGDGSHVDAYALTGFAMLNAVCQQTCGMGDVADLLVDGDLDMAWWATTTGAVVTAPIGSMATRTGNILDTVMPTPQRIARDTSYVYVTTTDSVLAVPIAGGAAPPLVLAMNEASPFGIAVDENNVYWTTADGRVRAVGVPR
jgi:hypothetical protein